MDKTLIARAAVAHTFKPARTVTDVIARLGYLQADPIRAPARAQDLILRQRLSSYRIDTLEQRYPELDVFEDMLHNYGFFTGAWRAVLYPRTLSPRWQGFMEKHAALRTQVLKVCKANAAIHPREVEQAIGKRSHVNGWGGTSSVTTLMLEGLHRQGVLQVVRRDAGIRVYGVATPMAQAERHRITARADAVIAMLVQLYGPIPMRSLTHLISMMGPYRPDTRAGVDYKKRIALMLRSGVLESAMVDGLEYVWPQTMAMRVADPSPERVRFLAPFDPLVWDRRRFEHVWGWAYRFEAYTPAAKRKLGYYALPMLWRDEVIGWVNASVEQDQLHIETGFVQTPPREPAFKRAHEEEVERLRAFLRLKI